MEVNSTDLQNNFGKYLHLTAKEDIIVTKNNRRVAVLKQYSEETDRLGSENNISINETSPAYTYHRKKVTYEEYLKLTEASEERYEYIDGEMYLLASPKTAHQRALTELYGNFYNFFKGKKCVPMIAPYDIRLKKTEKDMNVVQPDLMIICDLKEELREDDYYYGIPVLVVEILSNSSRSKDYITKLDLYMSCGVKEYWIVDPLSREIHIYSFKDMDIEINRTYREGDLLKSYLFEELTIGVSDVFNF